MRRALAAILLITSISQVASAQWGDRIWAASNTGSIHAFSPGGGVLTVTAPLAGTSSLTGTYVAPNGDVWATGFVNNAPFLYRTSASGSTSTTYTKFPSFGRVEMAFDTKGDIWMTSGVQPFAYWLTPTAQFVSTISLGGNSAPTAVATTPTNHVFFCTQSGGVHQYVVNGSLVRTLTINSTRLSALAADSLGNCWVLDQASSGSVWRVNGTSGNVDTTISVADPFDVAVGMSDDVYVLTNSLVRRYASSGLLLKSAPLPPGTYSDIAIDGSGDVWVHDRTANMLRKYDRFSLDPLSSISVSSVAAATIHGDPSGFALASAPKPTDDPDQDQVDNKTEIAAGSNPFRAASTPTSPQPIQSGEAKIGTKVWLSCKQASDPSLVYVLAGSLNLNGPSSYIKIPRSTMVIPLESDPLFFFTLTSPALFKNFQGTLNPDGAAFGRLIIPNINALVGTKLFFAFVTLDVTKSQPFITVSNNLPLTIRR